MDQLLCPPASDISPVKSPVIQRQFVPNRITHNVYQPSEIVPDLEIQCTPVPAAAALDEFHLV